MSTQPTLGEQRVRITFNVSNNSTVDELKRKSAELINILQEIRETEELNMTHLEVNNEAINEQANNLREKIRAIEIAQQFYEDASMWAVKAVTAKI